MPGGTLRDLYQRELFDLYAIEQQIVSSLPQLAAAAHSPELQNALNRHLERTRIHVERLEFLFKQQGVSAPAAPASGMDSIRGAIGRLSEYADPDVKDAAIISAAQHIEHYEIAGYGCARTFARQLDDARAADLLQQTLDEEADADKKLTSIAESGVNQAASAGDRPERDEAAAGPVVRLLYVDVDDMTQRDAYRDFKVKARGGDEIGRLDGFVIDAGGRPYYLVVKAGGLFGGGRHLLPIGRADLNRSARELVVDLDKDTLKRYPEFHDDEFEDMTEDETRRYEWRVLEAIDPNAARASVSSWDYGKYPYYQQPAWFDRAAIESQRRTSAGSRSQPRQLRTERGSGERVVARERELRDDIEPTVPERERTRGRGPDER